MKGLLEGVGSVIASLGRSDQFVKTRLRPFVIGLRILGKLLLTAVPVSQRKQRSVIIWNWHNTQSWHKRGAVAVP
jgi:hypothetical protein